MQNFCRIISWKLGKISFENFAENGNLVKLTEIRAGIFQKILQKKVI